MKLDRRTFIELLVGFSAGAGAGFLATPVNWKLMDDVSIWTQNWPWVPVPERGKVSHVDTVCNLCPGGCGITVRKVGDRATKIEGREGYPVNDGGICLLGAAGLQLLYGEWREPALLRLSGRRVPAPMRRVGKRGEGKWEEISWEAAIGEVVAKLADLRGKGEAHTVACILGSDRGTVPQLFDRFLKAYGSPNFICTTSAGDTYELAAGLMEGSAAPRAYDLEGANFILSFGCGLIEGWGSPVRSIRAHSLWRSGNGNEKATVVQVEPRLSNTAAKADDWVPINPGTEGALALGLAHVIIKERLYDANFINKHAFGFEDCEVAGRNCMGFKRLVMHHYSPEAVSRITGIAASKIVALGQAFAKADRPLALWGRGKATAPGSLYECMAVHALNALVGNINKPGGVSTRPRLGLPQWPEISPDSVAVAGSRMRRIDGAGTDRYPLARYLPDRLPGILNHENGGAIKALLVHEADPYYTMLDSAAVAEAFARIPFIVSFSTYMDETASHADLILPNHHYLERWEDVPTPVGLNKPIISVRRPVVSPQFDTRHVGDVIIGISKGLGGSVAEAFPSSSYETLLRETIPSDTWGTLEETGFVEVKEFKVPEWNKTFQTASRKFEFYVTALDQAGMKMSRDEDYLPHYEPVEPEGDSDTYPLTLIPVDLMRLASGPIGNPPFCTKTLEENELKGNNLFIEINPKTAAESGLSEGQWAMLETPKGQAKVLVHLSEGIMPGVVGMPKGLGHTAYDDYLAGKGVSANSLLGVVEDPVSGLTATWGIRAKLTRV